MTTVTAYAVAFFIFRGMIGGMALHLSTPATALPGIGALAAKDLKNLGIVSVRDLLLYLPFRYDDFSVVKPIASLRHDETVTVSGRVRTIESRPSKNRRVTLTEAIVEDETGGIKVTWFNQPYLEKTLHAGSLVSLAGRVDNRFGRTLVSPVWEPAGARIHTGRIVPVYGLSGTLTMRRLRGAIKSALPAAEELVEWLPGEIVTEESFPLRAEAYRAIHFPESRTELDAAIARLKFEELFLHQLMFAEVRRERAVRPSQPIKMDTKFLKAFVSSLPFALTNAQRKAAWEIVLDMEKERPMNRLLEGDVGSGKTAVAAIAIADALHAGGSAAYLAPTEILAAQQQASLAQFFRDPVSEFPKPGLGMVGLLTSSQAKIGVDDVSRKELLQAVVDGNVRCLVGTHALLQGVEIPNLALVVIDEQHRFGVQQRKALLERNPAPHLLSMTATPIPRSLALTIYGDLDLSVLDEMPKGRKPVATRLVFEKDKNPMWDHVLTEIRAGRQIFVVCPLIDPSDTMGAKSVVEMAKMVTSVLPKTIRVGMLHGKLSTDDKTAAIEEFRTGQTEVLVSTTVVEVGVDVPNASIIVISGAELFGLSQLHQLRGRVGRSDVQSYCYLMPDGWSPDAKTRLTAMTRTTNGFELAEIDLKLRGAGNVFGTSQSGFPDFKLATEADIPLMKKTRDIAARLLAEDPKLETHPMLREQVKISLDEVHLE
jgi:ATP-dependent DNA helicase RecG